MKTDACVTSVCLSCACGVRQVRGGRIPAAPPRVAGMSLCLSVGTGIHAWPPHTHPRLRGPSMGVRLALVDGIEDRAEGVDELAQGGVLLPAAS